jgi:hypothetical protein
VKKLTALLFAIALTGVLMTPTGASSHREAPLISGDPRADNTDVYAFVSPDQPGTVTIIANYIPLEEPAGGPNFHSFDENVLYEIHVDNDGNAKDDVTYQFRFRTKVRNRNTFLYNTGQITSLDDPTGTCRRPTRSPKSAGSHTTRWAEGSRRRPSTSALDRRPRMTRCTPRPSTRCRTA